MTRGVWIIFLGLFVCVVATSQEREVISSAGKDTMVNETYYSFTIGETIVEKGSIDTLLIASGFQQSDVTVSIHVKTEEIFAQARIYPNPSSQYFFLELENEVPDSYSVVLHHSQGYFVFQKHFSNKKVRIETFGLPAGVYYLTVIDKNGRRLNQFKVLKKN